MATIKDIAKLANISPTTVSRILNRDPSLSVSSETLNRVTAIAKDLNYKTRAESRSGSMKQTSVSIGAIQLSTTDQSDIQNDFFARIRRGIEIACSNRHFDLRLCSGLSSQLLEVDGVIVIGDDTEFRNHMADRINNVVFVDHSPNPDRFDAVLIDYESGSHMVLNHLIDSGHETIGYIGGTGYPNDDGKPGLDPRHFTFESRMRDFNKANLQYVYIGPWTATGGYECMKRAIAHGSLPSAFFVGSDRMALGALMALEEAGYRVPEDVSVIGFDDIELAKYSRPPLTTVKTFPELMGDISVKLLLERIEGREVSVQVKLSTKFVSRKTCVDKG